MAQRLYDKTFIKPTVSRYEKQKNNFARQIAIADYYDQFYGGYRDGKRLRKFSINYDLANGRIDTSLYDVEDDFCMIDGERVTISKGEIPHIPMTSLVVKSLQGEQLQRPWKISVDDESPLKDSIQTEEWKKQLKGYIQTNVIGPYEEQAMQRVMAEIGQLDQSLLSPEELQQLQQQIQQEVNADVTFQTPEELLEYMSNDFQNPIAKQAQELMNHLDKKFNIKALEVEGFSHMLPTAEEYYYVNMTDHGLEFDMVPPDSVEYGGPAEEVWVQKMDWCKIEKWTTVRDIRSRYAEVLKPSHIEELDKLYEPRFGSSHYNNDNNPNFKEYMHEFSSNPDKMQEEYGNQDWKLKENFGNIANAFFNIRRKWGEEANLSEFAIREAKIFWKEDRVMYRVYKLEDGKVVRHYYDEHYIPSVEDLEVKKIIAPEVWECTKIGTEDPIYLNIRPLKGQYKSNENPYEVELPVVGKAYNTSRGRTKNISIIDLMKQFQRDYDTEMAALRRDLASNIGKVFVMLINAKPKNMSWSDMLSIAKEHNLMLIDPVQRGAGGIDPQFLKEVNMSKMSEIAERVNLLNNILGNLFRVAGFNEARVGQGGQYASSVNLQINQQAAFNQTEPMFEAHREIVEKALTRLMNIARVYYKEHPEELKNILSPSSYIELQYGYPFWYSYFNIRLENSGKVARQVQELKQYTQAFIQNGMDPKDVLHLAMAESKNDIMDLLGKIEKKQGEAQKQALQMQQEQMMTSVQIEQQKRDEERQFLMAMEKMKLEASDIRSQRDSEKFRVAADVDADGKADLLESKILEIDQRAKEHEDKMALASQQQGQTTTRVSI